MTTISRQFEEAHLPPVPGPQFVVGTEPHRAPRRPAPSIGELLDRVRALQRSEPRVGGDLRTSVLAELALVQLEAERLSLDAWRENGQQHHTNLNAAALADQVDRLSIHWPLDAEPNPSHPESVAVPNESIPS